MYKGNGWYNEKLKGKIPYGCFCFVSNQKISVSDTVVGAGKVGCCNSTSKCTFDNEQRCGIQMAIL